MTTEHVARELRTLKNAVLHLNTVLHEDPGARHLAAGKGLSTIAWLLLPGDEAASIERALHDIGKRCEHGWLSTCTEPPCVVERNRLYDGWEADRQLDEWKDRELERCEPEYEPYEPDGPDDGEAPYEEVYA